MHKNHFELEGQTKVILIEKYETQIYQLTLNHAEARNRAIICNKNMKQMLFWRPFFVLLI